MKKLVTFQMEESEIEMLRHEAHQSDMNVSEYIRWLVKKQRKTFEDEKRYRETPNKHLNDLY